MKTYTLPLTLVAIALLVLAGVLAMKPFYQTLGAAQTGFAAHQQFATTSAIGPGTSPRKTVFADSADNCKSRIVTVHGDATGGVFFLFGEPSAAIGNLSSSTLEGSTGHYQAASTTVVYDSGLYGCDAWYAYSGVSTTLILSEF